MAHLLPFILRVLLDFLIPFLVHSYQQHFAGTSESKD